MISHHAVLRETSIVLRGAFNPQIFQPRWLAAEGLLRNEEAEAVAIELIHPQLAKMSLEWFSMQITQDSFIIKTTQEPYNEFIRDLVLGIFKLLSHTPVGRMGVNKDVHVRADNVEDWHRLGNLLAPKGPWEGILDSPGLRGLVMEESRRDGLKGYIRVNVEPSPQVQPGVYVQVNDHYEVANVQNVLGTDEIVGILDHFWASSQKRSTEIIDSILKL